MSGLVFMVNIKKTFAKSHKKIGFHGPGINKKKQKKLNKKTNKSEFCTSMSNFLCQPPGVGKTMLASALAGELAGLTVLRASIYDFTSKYMSDGDR